MSNDTANAAFSKVLDTTYDSKVLQGLLRILPESLRIIKGTLDIDALTTAQGVATAGQLAVGEVAAFLDDSGNPIQLNAGDQIVYINAIATTDLADTTAVPAIGLCPTSYGTDSLVTALITVTDADDFNPSATTGLFDGTDPVVEPGCLVLAEDVVGTYLVCDNTATATLTTGVLQVTLVVV